MRQYRIKRKGVNRMDAEFPTTITDLGIKNQVVIVTGASRGIGRAIARIFAQAGAKIIAVARDKEQLNTTLSQMENRENHLVLNTDLAEIRNCKEIVEIAEKTYGRIDTLINGAAVLSRIPMDQVDESYWQCINDVNLKSLFFLSRAAAGVMKKNHFGRIVNITSTGAYTGGLDNSVVYSTFKGGVITLTKGLAREYAGYGINVNAIAPGMTDTRMMALLTPERLREVVNQVPLKRMAKPEEIALSALFLASKWASYITGAVLDVNGGQYMR
ncbi:3-oxoacyl-[acyl-carrier-protein] reductase FabG [Peptococcaceae bacterium CEB3]|nr:3-oxoacyl-[acyl-carrier-protein] reductase FabG [Peptococcaceae bacterium CEB3]